VPAITRDHGQGGLTQESVVLAAPAGAPWPGAGQGTGMFLPVADPGVRADQPGAGTTGSGPDGAGSDAAGLGAAVPPDMLGGSALSRGIPSLVLDAYRRAADSLQGSDPGCGLPWWLLAGIGRIESGQASGGRVDAAGTTRGMILGPRLDGSVAGTAVIRDTDGGALDLDPTYDRAVGPMQFLPGTWRLFASDGNADGRSDPHNVYDAALAAGRYLCASGGDLRTPTGLATAVLSYNYSTTYLSAVLAWGLAYRDGVWSTALSPGSVPPPPPEQPAPTASTAPPASSPPPAPTRSAPPTSARPTASPTSAPPTASPPPTTKPPTTVPPTTAPPTTAPPTTTVPPTTEPPTATTVPPTTVPPTTAPPTTTAVPPTTAPPTTSPPTTAPPTTASSTSAVPTRDPTTTVPSPTSCVPPGGPDGTPSPLGMRSATAPTTRQPVAAAGSAGPESASDPSCVSTPPATPSVPGMPTVSPSTKALSERP
jgi:hypothetical protein